MKDKPAGGRLREWWDFNRPQDASDWSLLILIVLLAALIIALLTIGIQATIEGRTQSQIEARFTEGVIVDMGKYAGGRSPLRYSCWMDVRTPEGYILKYDVSDSVYDLYQVGDAVTREDIIR